MMNNIPISELRSYYNRIIPSHNIFHQNVENLILYKSNDVIKNELLIDIKYNIIGNSEISFLYRVLAWLKSENFKYGEIYILLSDKLEYFCSAFVSLLYLLNKGYNCEINIYGQENNSRIYEFIHMMYSGQLSPDSDYFFKTITYANDYSSPKIWGLINNFNANRYVVSSKNLPLIPITKENIQKIFVSDLSSILSEDLFKRQNTDSLNYKDLFKVFSENYPLNNDLTEFKKQFYTLHFYRLLDNLHILKAYLNEKDNKEIIYSSYYNKIKAIIITPLQHSPVFVTLILYILLDEDIVKKNLINRFNKVNSESRKIFNSKIIDIDGHVNAQEILNEYSEFLEGQVQLAFDIFKGLFELAKNTVEHSSNNRGVLTFRRIKQDEVKHEKNENSEVWSAYWEQISDINGLTDSFIDISIVDDGVVGIIENSRNELNNLGKDLGKRKITQDAALEDVRLIQEGLRKNEAELLYKMYFNPYELYLTRQAHKAMASYGLFIFSKFIQGNHGIFNVHTNHVENKAETLSFYNSFKIINFNNESKCPFGTQYNITIPIVNKLKENKGEYVKLKEYGKEEITPPDSLFRRMLTFHPERKSYINFSNEITGITAETIIDIKSNEGIILLISIEKEVDRSSLLRLFFKVFIEEEFNAIIVKNISEELLVDYLDLLFDFSEIDNKSLLLPESKAIFFYLNDEPQSLFVLAGTNKNECSEVFSTIENNKLHESAYKYNQLKLIIGHCEFPTHLISPVNKNINPLFVDNNLIVRLDFLDTADNGLTRFEQSAKEHLEKNLAKGGYKWSGTHLKIGSKLHLDDFIYGKKLFQKNYEAARFAYSLALHFFHREHKEFINSPTPINYTFIGYGFYSELLVSRICEFVDYQFQYTNEKNSFKTIVSYAIVKDEEEIKFSKFHRELYNRKNQNAVEKVIIIVPISSTLTTCLKIENAFLKSIPEKHKSFVGKNSKFRLYYPFYSVVIVGDGTESEAKVNINKDGSVISNYWDSIDIENKIIKTINREEKIAGRVSERENYYQLYLKSKWNHVEDCTNCFPKDNPLEEKPLFMTDKVAVTPTLVFSSHRWQNSTNTNEPLYFLLQNDSTFNKKRKYIDDSMLTVVHYKGQDKDFQYYLRYTDIVNKNKAFIEDWSKNLFNKENEGYKRALLIAPDKSENGDFIHIVNRCLFQERANVIKVDVHGDYYLNFDQFFRTEINDAEEIYFIDNLIATGNTFSLIYDNLKNIDSNLDNKKIGVITLINRMDYESSKKFLTKIKISEVYSFFEINVPVVINPNRYCPMCEEEKIYKELCETSSLDIIRQYFNDKELPYYTPMSKEDLIEGKKYEIEKYRNSSILKLLFTHYINKSFSTETVSSSFVDILKKGEIKKYDQYNFDSFAAGLKEYIQIDNSCNLSEDTLNNIRFKSNIVKVLSQYPFKRYRGINIAVFYWVLNDLVLITNYILNEDIQCKKNDLEIFNKLNNSSEFNDEHFIDCLNYLRVLIKYGGILKISYLLHTKFIKAINKLINSDAFKRVLDENYVDNQSIQPDKVGKTLGMKYSFVNFKIFIVAHISKSLRNVESRALKLEENLFEVRKDIHYKNLVATNDSSFLDILALENTKIINEFIDSFDTYNLKNVYDSICKSYKYDSKIKNFISFYRTSFVQQDKTNDLIIQNSGFKSFVSNLIEVNNLLVYKSDTKEGVEDDFEEKAKHLTKSIGNILGYDLDKGGGFLLYKYQNIKHAEQQSKNTIVLGKVGDCSLADILDNCLIENSITAKILNGFEYIKEEKVTYQWTNYSIIKTENGSWEGQNNILNDAYETSIINDKYNRIIFCRVSDFKEKKDGEKKNNNDRELNGQAVFVFYDNQIDEPDKWSINRVRYVHVFRNKILKYFDRNYNSDSFRAWIEQKEKSSYMFILNHGIEVYEKTINNSIDAIKSGSNKIQFNESKELLRTAAAYLTNKIHIMSLYSELNLNKTIKKSTYTIKDILDEIWSNYRFIFTFKKEPLNPISNIENVILDYSLCVDSLGMEFEYPYKLIKELSFELLYNIRKHSIHKKYQQITVENKLKVVLALKVETSVLYLTVSNNHYNSSIKNISVFNKLLYNKQKDGLNLINNILYSSINCNVYASIENDIFTINVPLKRMRNE